MMKIPVEIYAFVGVIGSGKSHRLEQMKREYNGAGQVVITADFSDGIRDLTRQIFGYSSGFGDVNSEEYRDWKNNVVCEFSEITSHGVIESKMKGRDILRRIGEGVKDVAGVDVWARYTTARIYDQVCKQSFRSDVRVSGVRVLIGSVRFKDEVQSIFQLYRDLMDKAQFLDMEPQIHFIFCDYHSPSYDATSHHISEAFAQAVIGLGRYKDGDDITEIVNYVV